jgi:GAF domain-containing protein
LARQSRYERALAKCSTTLLHTASTGDEQQQLLNEALAHLRVAVQADRAYLFENFDNPEDGFCSGIRAEASIPEVRQNLLNPDSQKIPWSVVPEQNQIKLANGRFVGGPIAQTFAGKPDVIDWLQDMDIQSVLFLPIHFEDHWWGYVGFDDCQEPREWQAEDVVLLQTAAEIIGSTLQRWQAGETIMRQHRFQKALAQCSRILLENPGDEAQENELLTEVLGLLQQAVQASRAYITATGVVELSTSAFPMFNATLFIILLWLWRPKTDIEPLPKAV